jgi:AraC-like DNA-binding protein
VCVDIDDYLHLSDRFGSHWASQLRSSVECRMRGVVAGERSIGPLVATVEHVPPDSWSIVLAGVSSDDLPDRASSLARRLVGALVSEDPCRVSVAVGRVSSGPHAAVAASRDAAETMCRKMCRDGETVLVPSGASTFEASDISATVEDLLRTGRTELAASVVTSWVVDALRHGASSRNVLGWWLPALIMDLGSALTSEYTTAHRARASFAAVPLVELAGLSDLHERRQLEARLRGCFERLARQAGDGTRSLSLVDRADNLLREKFADPGLTLVRLASAVSTSPYHLAHVLQRDRGKTFRQLLISYRINRARHLLQSTSLSVTSVAQRCGFTSARHLQTTMRRELGISPTQVRSGGLALSKEASQWRDESSDAAAEHHAEVVVAEG